MASNAPTAASQDSAPTACDTYPSPATSPNNEALSPATSPSSSEQTHQALENQPGAHRYKYERDVFNRLQAINDGLETANKELRAARDEDRAKIASLETRVARLTEQLCKESSFRSLLADAFTNDKEDDTVDLFSQVYDEVNTPTLVEPTTREDLGLIRKRTWSAMEDDR